MATKSTKKKDNNPKKVINLRKETIIPVLGKTKVFFLSLRKKLNFLKILSRRKLLVLIGLSIFALLAVFGSKFLVVAWVDKKPITVFEYYRELDKKYGKDVKEQLIVERLINDEAANKKINISKQDLDNEIKRIENEQGGKDKLSQILDIQGISQDEFNKLVRLQLIKQKMFEANVKVSDEDVNKYIEDNKVTDADDKMIAQIKEQLRMQKINAEFNNWLKGALQSSRISRV